MLPAAVARPMSPEVTRFLAGVPLLREVPEGTIARLAERATEHRYEPLKVILMPGLPDGFLAVVEGDLYVMMGPGAGNHVLADVLGPEDVIDPALLRVGKTTGRITSGSSGARVIHLPQSIVVPIIAGTPAVAELYGRILTRRLYGAYEQMAKNIWEDATERLYSLLQRLGQIEGQRTEDGVWLNRAPTQEILAQMLGTARETVNRSLTQLTEAGRIMREGRRIFVRNRI